MKRRTFIAGALATVPTVASAHTPYGQWVTYRRKHLLIGCHRGDLVTYDLAKQLVAELDHALPDAKARVARAPHPQRLASLMGTEQLDLSVLSVEDAVALSAGTGPFTPYGTIPVGVLTRLPQGNLLIARQDFRPDHAWLIISALTGLDTGDPADVSLPLDWHPGAGLWRADKPMPRLE